MKVLQITYYYPPMGGAGVQRGLKFSKYLGEYGVRPIVLCAYDPHYIQDLSLVDEVPADLQVHRVEHTPLVVRLAARRRKSAPPRKSSTQAAPGLRGKFRDAVLAAWNTLHYPDDKIGWARGALREARQIIRSEELRGEPIDLIFTSSPPASAHWIGDRLARQFDLPWVADFRDLWTDNPAYSTSRWRRAIDRHVEQEWLDRATGVVTVTPSWERLLTLRRQSHSPSVFIPNGYDEDDFAGRVPAAPQADVFTLVHTGTFYGTRDPSVLFNGLTRYLMNPEPSGPRLRVRLVGSMGGRFQAAAREFEGRHPGVLELFDYLPHAQALGELMAADALLLVVGSGRGAGVAGWLPGKIFEYLRAGKPILMLGAPDGDAANLVRRYGSGWIVDAEDAESLANSLRSMLQGSSTPTDASAIESSRCFERRELSRQMAEYMRACVSSHRSHSAPRRHLRTQVDV